MYNRFSSHTFSYALVKSPQSYHLEELQYMKKLFRHGMEKKCY